MSLRIRLKLGENEIELEGDAKFIERHLRDFLKKQNVISTSIETPGIALIKKIPGKIMENVPKITKTLTPAEYFKQKQPNGGTEQLIVFAKYLEDYKSLTEFGNKDINEILKAARLKKLDNKYYHLAIKQGLINKLKRGKYSLSLSGEDAAIAMPSPVK